ncbi:DUF1659 domain-containing protein [Alkaliphilus sp. MSJ-5]|uniref:DUF1659 domain-containing protein n=1 Tax=Alkaliphilus flagellatus TaxID=2841507 RepID=A0ABS6G4W1_9FIRM|nr:DUF1659 domain-containing protein [Alkaliphilus flagellatus]MBU5676648.1 DUF1659 domain-containing protein [Alkaliphilus flagellatus]
MPVNIINQSSRIRLRFIDGVDGEGKEKLVSKTYSNVKGDADDSDIYAVAVDMARLQTKSLKTVVRTDEKELVE